MPFSVDDMLSKGNRVRGFLMNNLKLFYDFSVKIIYTLGKNSGTTEKYKEGSRNVSTFLTLQR